METNDNAGAEEAELRRARARRPPTSARACAGLLADILRSLHDDFLEGGAGEGSADMRRLRDEVHEHANRLLDRITRERAGDRGGNEDGGVIVDGGLADGLDRSVIELQVLQGRIGEVEAAHTTACNEEDRRKWNDWIAEGIDRGAGRAHAYSRTPTAWVPTTASTAEGRPTAAIDALMEEQRAKYSGMWRPVDQPFRYEWEDSDELPPMAPDRLRDAAGTFAAGLR